MGRKIKIGDTFRYRGRERTVMKRIKGVEIKRRPNMQSDNVFIGYHRKPCKYELDDGSIVTSQTIHNSIANALGNTVTTKKDNYDYSKPFHAQELGDEWDHYAWSADDPCPFCNKKEYISRLVDSGYPMHIVQKHVRFLNKKYM